MSVAADSVVPPAAPAGAGIAVRQVTKRFGSTVALDTIDATCLPGRLTGLVGPDGAGKTTLMRLLAALLIPDAGRIEIDGFETVGEAARVHETTGYMPQRFGLYEDLRVLENLELHARLRGLCVTARAAAFDELLEFTRLRPFTRRLAGKLSGGMKQKLGLACALLGQPSVLLLDEPSVGVDPLSRRDLWAIVRRLVGNGMTVVWSTAYLDEAERCDDVLLLDDGRIAYAGSPGSLSARVARRSFQIRGARGDRRVLLAEALELDEVRDGVIQGDAVRLVTTTAAPGEAVSTLAERNGGRLVEVTPRFEDAFIDLLGGGPGGRSPLAERMGDIALGTEIAVSCRGLTKHYGHFAAAEDISFDVRRGELFGLLGPNGAGKSTTFKMLCGLLRPTAGTAEVAGHDLATANAAAKQRVGYMAQKFSLYGLLTVRQNLHFFAGVYGLGRATRARIDEMVDTFELERYLPASPDALPLGYRQRLALACALMHRPAVLFLDEPTSGVDPLTRREFWTHINGLVRKGVTVMVTTHFMDEAEYCDRVAMIDRARLIGLAPPDALKRAAASAQQPSPTMEDAFIAMVERHRPDGVNA